jgi:hypothetical protein
MVVPTTPVRTAFSERWTKTGQTDFWKLVEKKRCP